MSRFSVCLAAALVLPGVAMRSSEALSQVWVDPDGGTASKPQFTPGNTVTFQVTNNGDDDNFTFSCSRTGAVTACTPPGSQFIAGGASIPLWVTFTTGSANPGTVTLAAQGFLPGSWDSGSYNVTVTEPTPPDPQLMVPTGDVSVEFPTIKIGWCDNHSLNAGSRWIKVNGIDRTSSFDYNTADGPSCTARAASTTNSVSLNLGSNSVEARICDNSGNCTAETYSITRRDAVAPTANLLSATTVSTEFPTIQLEWCDNESLNAGTRWIKVNGVDKTSSFNYVSTGGSSCGALRATSTTSSVSLVGGSNTVEASICDNWSNCISPPRSFTITRNLAAPLVASWPYTPEKRDYSLCAVPGCFALIYAQSTVPYFSQDTPRNLTLVYNSDRVSPQPLVHVDVKRDPASPDVPTKFQLQVKVNGALVTFLNGEATLNFQHINDGEYHRLGGQFDAAAHGLTTTGVYPMEIVVTAVYSGAVSSTSVQTVLVLVNQSNSAIARGWTIAEAQRLYTRGDSVLIVEGGGNSLYFRKSGSTFVSPPGEFSRVTGGPPWTRAYPDSTKLVFDNAGLLDYAVDRFGNVTDFGYDASNRLSSGTDPAGYTITLSYGANGLQSITDHFGRVTNVTVQPDKRLTEIRDPDNKGTTFGYDGSLRLISVTERRGFTTKFAYDPNSGQLASDSSPPVPVFGDPNPTRTLVTTYASWDKVGVPYGPTGPPVAPARWDTISGRVMDPGGHVTRFWSLNRYRQAHETGLPLGAQLSARYTSLNQLRHLTQPIGTIDSIGYDASGLPTYLKAAGQTPTNIHYAGWAQPDSAWGSGQPRQRMWVGANGRVDSLEAGAAGSATRMRYKYDGLGRVTSIRDPLQHQTDSMVYTGTNGNTLKAIRPGNRTTTFGYDIYGRVTSIAETGMPTRTIRYDAINRVTRVLDGVNPDSTRYWYDVNFGSFTKDSVVDPKGQVYKFSYDQIGRLLNQQHPSGHVVASYEYGWDSEVKRVTNARGQNIDFTYDTLHRLVKSFGDSIQNDSLHYSADHRVITAFGPVTTDWTYLNVRGVPDSVKTRRGGWDYWLRYAYTAAGLLDSVAPSGVCCPPFLSRNYGYNTARGTLDSIRLNGALTRFTLNNDLQPGTVTFPGGDQVSRGFTALHGDMVISSSAAYNTTTERKITYDTPGRLWRQLRDNMPFNQGVGHLYSYDGLGRLVTDTLAGKLETTPSCTGQDPLSGMECSYDGDFWSYWWVMDRDTFAYDAVGNRLDNGGGYTTGNRITAFAGCGYGTDPDGNVTFRDCTGQRVDIRWDAANRPTRFTVNGVAYDLYYDASGRVVRKDSAGVVTRYFLWDGDNLFAELQGVDGEKVAEYSYYPGLDNLHAVIKGSTPYNAHTDGLGNVVALTSASQELAWSYGYDAWGQPPDPGADSLNNRARFKGALWMGPEVDFYYMRNRWYEPKTGRFLSEDPIGLEGGINPYLFADADPVGGRDPLGLQGEPPPWNCLEGPTRTICRPYVFDEVTVVGSLTPWGTSRHVPWGLQGGRLSNRGWGESIYRSLGGTGDYRQELEGFRRLHPDPGVLLLKEIGPIVAVGAAPGALGFSARFLTYPRAGGFGVNIYRNGRRILGLDWHRFGPTNLSRPHIDFLRWRHWPW